MSPRTVSLPRSIMGALSRQWARELIPLLEVGLRPEELPRKETGPAQLG